MARDIAIDRRGVIGGLAALPFAGTAVAAQPAPPTPHFHEALAALAAGREVKSGRVRLDIPQLAESGSSVSLKIAVESPMTDADHVRTVHVLSEQNPIAAIGRFHLNPRSGRAAVETSVRLRTTQHVHALAEMSDGSLYAAKAEVVVLLAACLDPG